MSPPSVGAIADRSEASIANPLQGRIDRLDGFRGLAILLVLLGHEFTFTLGFPAVMPLAGLGVLLFFVLSGFLITRLLCQELEASHAIDLRHFYARRALRILPALLVFLATMAVLFIVGAIIDVTWKSLLACLLFVRNIRGRGESVAHIWSLSIEEQFYLCWPVALQRLGRQKALLIAVSLATCCVVWRGIAILAHVYPYSSGTIYLRTDFRIDAILGGCIVALAFAEPSLRTKLVNRIKSLPGDACLLVLIAWTLWGESVVSLRPIFLTVQTALSILLFLAVLTRPQRGALHRFLTLRAMMILGTLSYSLYLWQQVFTVTRVPSWGALREFPLNLIATFMLAILSYRFVERPMLKLKARLSRTSRQLAK